MPEMTGGCLCGQVRYLANADPVVVAVAYRIRRRRRSLIGQFKQSMVDLLRHGIGA